MTQALHPLTASMVNQLNRVDVISNNLANANTKGFKEDALVEGSFNNYLEKKIQKDQPTDKESVVMNTIPKIDGSFMDEQMGSIKSTGNTLDFALNQRDMFFKIKKPNGEQQLTRDGSFKVLDGQLVTQNGDLVLDKQNNPITVNNDKELSTDIGVVKTPFTNLTKVGDNNYKVNNSDEMVEVVRGADYTLRGAIETSNVNTIKSMVQLIEAQREFERSQKAITSIDAINGKVIDSIGNGR